MRSACYRWEVEIIFDFNIYILLFPKITVAMPFI